MARVPTASAAPPTKFPVHIVLVGAAESACYSARRGGAFGRSATGYNGLAARLYRNKRAVKKLGANRFTGGTRVSPWRAVFPRPVRPGFQSAGTGSQLSATQRG